MKCLLVEDHASTRELMQMLLKDRGYEVTECEEAETAWNAYSIDHHDLVLIDWMLPKSDGLSLCRQIRSNNGGKRSVILVCTARRTTEDLQQVLDAGADDYLAKPFDPDVFGIRMLIAEHLAALKLAEENRRKLEAQIQHAQRLESLGVLAGGIAHDFNNLLVAIMGNADLALMDSAPHAASLPHIQAIKTAALRAAELTQQMLAYSGKGRFVVESVDLNALIAEMGNLLQVSIPKNITLQHAFTKPLPAIEADASQMRQVVMNMITNAAEAIGTNGGTVRLATGIVDADRRYLSDAFTNEKLPEGKYVFMEVSDNGCGMDEATRQKIFDPFFSTKFTGRGLGLAAVLGIVRSHRGTIQVESEPGRGTRFKVLLPASLHPVKKNDRHHSGPNPWRGSGTVLVMDDEEGIRSVIKATLERFGFEVLTANDGIAGVELFCREASRINMVILDMTMPRMSGQEALRELRRIRSDIPVVLSSGHSEQEAMNVFEGKGLAGFIKKPFTLNELIDKVRAVAQ